MDGRLEVVQLNESGVVTRCFSLSFRPSSSLSSFAPRCFVLYKIVTDQRRRLSSRCQRVLFSEAPTKTDGEDDEETTVMNGNCVVREEEKVADDND